MKAHLKSSVNFRPATATVQTEKAREDQVQNNAGGFVFQVSDLDSVKRFLVLGTEGGSYYASEKRLTKDMVNTSLKAIQAKGEEVVSLIVEISDGGRAVKNSPALFLLAASAAMGNLATRRAALNALPKVARIGTHLFEFLEYSKQFRGWGRALKTAVGNWYETKEAADLAYQMIKYRNREGWTHRDVLRKAHPVGVDDAHKALYDWTCHDNVFSENLPSIVRAFEQAQGATASREIVEILQANPGLPWEALPTQHLKSDAVWKQLLPKLPLTALVRNLGRLTSIGVLKPLSSEVDLVVKKLNDAEYLRKARVHPLTLYVAKRTYDAGQGDKGSLTWTPVPQISGALEKAFYKAFDLVEPTGKRFLLALDVSSSMSWGACSGVKDLSPAQGSALMALTTAKSEEKVHIFGFSTEFKELGITAEDSFNSAVTKVTRQNFGGTDCGLPMLYAMKHNLKVDMFVVYTDNETWAGTVHPYQALKQYRQKSGINAKLVVVCMQANDFTIADPKDPGMLDVVGFDTNTPAAISAFAAM